MASVTKRGKKWTAIYTDRNGKQIWKTGFVDKGQTLKLAQTLEDAETAISTGMVDADQVRIQAERVRPVADHVDEYHNHLTAGGRSDNHIRYTVSDIRDFMDFAKSRTAAAVTREAVDRWVIYLVAQDEQYREWKLECKNKSTDEQPPRMGEPNSARTINRRVGSLQAFLKWAVEVGAISRYPLAKYPKREVRGKAIRESRALSDDEINKLLPWAEKNAPSRADLYRFVLSTGCRADECENLTEASFDLKHATLTIHGKDPRHTNRVDTIPISPAIVRMIKRLSNGDGQPLFLVPRMQAETLRKDCADAGVNPKGVSFHGLRHTFVTRLARANVHPTIAQRLARHRDVAITLGYYTHWSVEDDMKALELISV